MFRRCLLMLAGLLIASAPITAGYAPAQAGYSPARIMAWGEPIVWEGYATRWDVYRRNVPYAEAPLLVTDTRTEPQYGEVESFEMRSMDLYRAEVEGALLERQPVVMIVHGGAWTDGYAEWYSYVARSFTGEKGWLTAVVDYRLTSDQVFLADAACPDRATCELPANAAARTKAAWYPDNIQDVAAALHWLRDHAAENGGDPGRIFVLGQSAGGHLVALLATHPAYADLRPSIQGLISMSGAYDLAELNMAVFAPDINQTFSGGFTDTAALDEASPATYVSAGLGLGLPPVYLLQAKQELPSLYEQTLAFKQRLESLGLAPDYTYLAGYTHYTEMEVLGDMEAQPTRSVVSWIEARLAELAPAPRAWVPWVVRR